MKWPVTSTRIWCVGTELLERILGKAFVIFRFWISHPKCIFQESKLFLGTVTLMEIHRAGQSKKI